MSIALTRVQRKAETRRALIEAASDLFARRGIEATSLDEVASSVGLTKGAVYAHFANKNALVEEVLQAASASVSAELTNNESSIAENFTSIGRDAAALLPTIPRQSVMLFLEYVLYQLRDPGRHRKELRQLRREQTAAGAKIEEATDQRGLQLLITGKDLSAIFGAIGNGLALSAAVDADAISPEAVVWLFAALGHGLEDSAAISELLSKRPNT